MPRYNLRVNVTAANIAQVRKMLAAHDLAGAVEKVNLNASRADRLSDCESAVGDAASEVESLKEELQEWRDNLPENMQSGEKASALDNAISELDDIYSNLDGIRWEVEFPGMMG
jgi:hypothetical protein